MSDRQWRPIPNLHKLICALTFYSQAKNADDVVITLAIRTPLTKARKGAFKDSGVEFLAYSLLKELKTRSGIDPALVEDFALGNVRCPIFYIMFTTHIKLLES